MTLGRCSMVFRHTISREEDETEICSGHVKLVSVNEHGKPVALPEDLRECVAQHVKPHN
jgi:acyl-CoA thioesterase FadM